jgi:DNA-binding beta-propeller fold protein YncE
MTAGKNIALYSIAALVLGGTGNGWSQMASQMPIGRSQGPVAIAALPSGTLVVLGKRGRLSLIDSNSGRVTLLKDTLGYFSPADMAAARMGNVDSIFVALYDTVGRPGLLAKYSLEGSQLQTWNARATFAGVAVDPIHQTVYIGDAITGEISSLSMDENSSGPSFLAEVSGVTRLGPLAVDAAGQRLFAADVGEGAIYVVDLRSRKSRRLASGMGEPAALTYDADHQRLFVADASRHCIWQISTNSLKPKVSIFSSAPELREPRGITLDAQHSVWVADHAAIQVFKLSPDGLIVQRISP